MDISDLLGADAVVHRLKANSKKQVLQELATRAAHVTGCAEGAVLDVLLERERLGTTGIGRGIAIPHGKLAGLDRIYAIFARLEHPVDFEAVDDDPVDLVFLLLAPENAGGEHLKALARISRLLRDEDICRKLRGSDSADALFALLSEATARAA